MFRKFGMLGILAVVAAVAGFVSTCLYTVQESEQVVITQFGRPVGDAITTPGLKLKNRFKT